MVSQRRGISERLDGPAVVSHALDDLEAHGQARGDHQVVVVLAGFSPILGAVANLLDVQVEARHGRGSADDALQHLPDRPDHVQGIQRGAHHLGEEWREAEVVLAAIDHDLPGRRQSSPQRASRGHPREATAHDHNSRQPRGHRASEGEHTRWPVWRQCPRAVRLRKEWRMRGLDPW